MKIANSNINRSHAEDAMADERTPEQREAHARLLKMAEEQGVKPMTLETLKAMGDVWPEDESVDDFIAAVQEWRSEGGDGGLA